MPPTPKRRIRLNLAFDGTDLVGWQIQPAGVSVQGLLQAALQTLLGEAVSVVGAGRTDAGVHARFFAAHFDTESASVPSERFAPALNSLLPPSVRVFSSQAVPFDFHARFSAVKRGYRYYLSEAPVPSPFNRFFCWPLRAPLRLDLLNQYAQTIVGRHNFSAFCAAGDESPSKEKEVFEAGFVREGEQVVFGIKANGFLWKMVRSLVGTMVDFEKKALSASEFSAVLASGDRSRAGTTAPPQGLFLTDLEYGAPPASPPKEETGG